MVRILLPFICIRAQKEGIWDLHLYAYKKMMPFFHRYDLANYAPSKGNKRHVTHEEAMTDYMYIGGTCVQLFLFQNILDTSPF